MNRRTALQMAGAAAAAAWLPSAKSQEKATAKSKPATIAMLVYPQFTALDLVGPHHLLSRLNGFETKLVWKSLEPITSDSGLIVQPTMTLKDCPEEVAVLFVPGGTSGTLKMMEDAEVQAFLKSRGATAGHVTSVCTGSLVLGVAGLLRGCKATSHWAARDVLMTLGAEPVDARVVKDRNRLTGGGVTAGVDFGLSLVAELRGEEAAKRMQLASEYAPAPPYSAGSPEQAGPALTQQMRRQFKPFVTAATAAAEKARASWQ